MILEQKLAENVITCKSCEVQLADMHDIYFFSKKYWGSALIVRIDDLRNKIISKHHDADKMKFKTGKLRCNQCNLNLGNIQNNVPLECLKGNVGMLKFDNIRFKIATETPIKLMAEAFRLQSKSENSFLKLTSEIIYSVKSNLELVNSTTDYLRPSVIYAGENNLSIHCNSFTLETKICSICLLEKERISFSKSQWTKVQIKVKCISCVERTSNLELPDKQCRLCFINKERSSFSKNQWNKGMCRGKCLLCVKSEIYEKYIICSNCNVSKKPKSFRIEPPVGEEEGLSAWCRGCLGIGQSRLKRKHSSSEEDSSSSSSDDGSDVSSDREYHPRKVVMTGQQDDCG